MKEDNWITRRQMLLGAPSAVFYACLSGALKPAAALASAPPLASSGASGIAQTAAELAVGVAPVNFTHPPLTVDRYGANTVPGTTDMTAAIGAAASVAAEQGGGVIAFLAATYLVTAQTTIPSNTQVSGTGAQLKLSLQTPITTGAFAVTGINVTFQGLSFDLGFTRLATFASYPNFHNAGVFGNGAINVQVIDCHFTNLYTVGVYFHGCNGLTVTGCSFSSPAQLQQLQLQHVHIQTCTGNMRISDNSFANAVPTDVGRNAAGVYASGTTGPISIENNTFDYCGRTNAGSHRLGVIDFYGNSVDIHVTSNKATNCVNQFMRLATCARVAVKDNYVQYAAMAATGEAVISVNSRANFFGVGQVGCQDIHITGNSFINNADATRVCVVLGTYDFVSPCKDIEVSDNTFTDMNQCVNTNGPMSGIRIERNMSRSVNGGTIVVQYGTIPVAAEHGITESQSYFDGIFINDNTIEDTGVSNRNGILIDITKNAPYTGRIGQFEVSRNKITSVHGNTSQAIACTSGGAAGIGQLVARGNDCSNFKYEFYLRNWNELTLEDNKSGSDSAAAFLLQSGNRKISRKGNRLSTGTYAD